MERSRRYNSIISFCGDENFPLTKGSTSRSENDFENEVMERFEKKCLQQAVTNPTWGKKTLDIAFYRNRSIFVKNGEIGFGGCLFDLMKIF